MSTNKEEHIEHEEAADPALQVALAELRQCQRPAHDLWSGIEARIKLPAQPLVPVEDRVAVFAALRADAAPQRDLWPAIEARMRALRWRRLRTPLTAATALAASLVVMLGLQVYREAGSATSAHEPLRASAAVVAAMRETHTDTALRPASMRPLARETRALVRANLKIVSSAETQLERALSADPDAAYLESLLESARQQKKDLRYALAER